MRKLRNYSAWPISSAKDPATRTAGTPAPRWTAAPVLEGGAGWEVDVGLEVTSGVLVAGTEDMLLLGLGVAVTALTRSRVLVIVVVEIEVVVSPAAT